MDATDVVIEFLRRKLKGSQKQAAAGVLKPAPAPEAEMMEEEMSPEDLAMLEQLGPMPEEEEEEEEEG